MINMEQRSRRSIHSGAIAIISAAVLAGGGAAWWLWHSHTPIAQSPSIPSTIAQNSLRPSPVQQTAQSLNIYWLKDTGKHLELVPKQVKLHAAAQNTVLEAAFKQLLTGPEDPLVASTIPQGTALRSVKVQQDGIHVDLSQAFTTGGGSASMTGRVAQVLYTATSLQPNAKVWIAVEGKPLNTLGGEGLELDQPLTRQNFKQNFTL